MAVDINGDGLILLGGTSSTQGRLRLAEDSDNGTNYIELTAPASVTSNKTITLPDSTGTMVVTGGAQTIEFGAGTVSAPSITTTGDTNTGIFFPAADTIAFTEGGAEAMRINSSGNVGIGATNINSQAKLEIAFDQELTTLGESRRLILNDLRGGTNERTEIGFGYASSTKQPAVIGYQTTSNTSNTKGILYFATRDVTTDTAPTERARITSGGYFKASNSGSYINSTGSYHEFYQTADGAVVYLSATNASYTNGLLTGIATRAASSAYSFLDGYSDSGNDLEFRLYGDGNGKCDGAWTGGGADYAEFFESANGQALTLGATVVLDGNKVREATDQDPASAIIGVVRPKEPSRASAMIGNSAWSKWSKKYLTDDFDRYIMEDHDVVEWEEQVLEREAVAAVEAVVDEEGNEVSPAVPAQEAVYKIKQHSYESHNIPAGITVPADATVKTHDDKGNKFQHYKLNPAWDKDAEYTPREQRPEWNIIGLVGQVKVLKGQPTNDRWVKMRDVSATVEEWFIR